MFRAALIGWLRKAQGLFQTDLVYLVKHGFWMSINLVGTALIGLVTSYLYANFLSKEQYGDYRYIFSLFSAVNAFSLTGINIAVTQAVAKGKEGTLLQSIPLQLKWNVFFSAAFVLVAGYYFYHGNTPFGLAFLTISLFGPLGNIANTYGAFLQGKKEFRAYSLISFGISVVTLVVMAATIFFHANVVGLVVANIGSTALIQVAAFLWTVKHYQPNKEKDPSLTTFSQRLSLLTALGLLVSQLDIVLLYHWFGAASVSMLSFITIVPDQLKGFVKIIGQVALPKFAVNETAESRTQAAKNSLKLGAIVFLVSLLYILVAPLVFHWLFPAYSASVGYSRIYALGMIFSVYQIPVSILFAHKQETKITRFIIFTNVFWALCSLILIPVFGLTGAIISRLIAQAANLAISSYYVWLKP